MSQECPINRYRKATLALRHIGKLQTDIPHHCLPMSSALWMKLKFGRNDNYVLDGIVEGAQSIGETLIPFFAIG